MCPSEIKCSNGNWEYTGTDDNVNCFYLSPLQTYLNELRELQDDVSNKQKLTWELNGCKKDARDIWMSPENVYVLPNKLLNIMGR